jgi:cytoskeletal protein CcmA (bactofilin family)
MFRRGENEERHDGPIQPREVRGKDGDRSEVTVVGHGANLEGTVVSTGSLRVDGRVKGRISAEGDVMLTEKSEVEADIFATNVLVAGKFTGNVTAKGRTELAATGRMEGNVTSKTLVVAEGAVFSGQSIMEGGRAASSPQATAVRVTDSEAAEASSEGQKQAVRSG